jgi:hypothetical protein
MTSPGAIAAIVAVAGRRIDAAGSTPERFPLRNLDRVRNAISAALAELPAPAAVTSAACGTDLLALEVAGALGIHCRVILPFPPDRFRSSSVTDRPGDWGPLFDRLIEAAAARGDLVVLDSEHDSDADAYARTNAAILDEGDALAALSRALRIAIIAWDGESRGADDLTEQFRSSAASRGWTIREIETR